jgi:hypothetical protein
MVGLEVLLTTSDTFRSSGLLLIYWLSGLKNNQSSAADKWGKNNVTLTL